MRSANGNCNPNPAIRYRLTCMQTAQETRQLKDRITMSDRESSRRTRAEPICAADWRATVRP